MRKPSASEATPGEHPIRFAVWMRRFPPTICSTWITLSMYITSASLIFYITLKTGIPHCSFTNKILLTNVFEIPWECRLFYASACIFRLRCYHRIRVLRSRNWNLPSGKHNLLTQSGEILGEELVVGSVAFITCGVSGSNLAFSRDWSEEHKSHLRVFPIVGTFHFGDLSCWNTTTSQWRISPRPH